MPQSLVEALGNPIVSTSANRSDEEVLTDPDDLQECFGKEVDLILGCGLLPVQPSSVISLLDNEVEVLREGAGDLRDFE